jgi:hypothetical protein
MARLPARVQANGHIYVSVISPFHHRIERMNSLSMTHAGTFGVSIPGRTVVFQIYRHDEKIPYYFLRPDDRRYFAGARHPYDVPAGDLTRDALLFGVAVPRALHMIAPGQRWTLLLQDWEAATVSLAMADAPGKSRSFVTLHNSYDCSIEPAQLDAMGINPESCPGDTILQRALGQTEFPVFTVSAQFAHDLVEDPLQTQVLAPHLQTTLRPRMVAVDNGPFVDLAPAEQTLAQAEEGNTQPLAQWKGENRQTFLKAISGVQPSDDRPIWGDPKGFSQAKGEACWFVMAGRDDARQKGYDVLAGAAQAFLARGGKGRFLFFPIPGDEGRESLGFLKRLAEKHPQSVLVFPFIFREGFLGALRGADYGVMPSLYEPFGMANEFYLNGTVGIGRASGGIVQQIVPLRTVTSFTQAVEQRALRWHAPDARPTGILFRERDGLPSETEDWQKINAAGYAPRGASPDRVEERGRLPLYQSMTTELLQALEDADQVVRDRPQEYYRMLVAGIRHIQQSFSWDRAALEYLKHLVH